MKKQYVKWLELSVLASYVAAVFMIADGHFWPGLAFIGAGTGLFSAAAVYKKKSDVSEKEAN